MNILIIGQGGREHALAWKAAQSNQVQQVWVAPGNAGTATEPKVKNINIAVDAVSDLVAFARQHDIALTIVGPETALAAGVVDAFNKAGLLCFGPRVAAAQLEISKIFCKDFLKQNQIPTARYASFTETQPALDYARQQDFPLVIKADGLAAGKGVIIANSYAEAQSAIEDMLQGNRFGAAGHSLIIEEFLKGEELSYIVMVDGEQVLPLASSQDHKRRNNGDLGPNTGGMGAYSPSPLLTDELNHKILTTIIQPTVAALTRQGTPYQGFLYAGLMIDEQHNPKVLEFNCRMGDPETQPIMMRLKSDLVELCLAACRHELNKHQAIWDERPALAVVMTSDNYPEGSSRDEIIEGLEIPPSSDCKIFHAGTSIQNNHIVTNGGRVLAVTALGTNLQAAQTRAYQTVHQIHWPNCYYRDDIGFKALSAKNKLLQT